jgi:hypothetical protein
MISRNFVKNRNQIRFDERMVLASAHAMTFGTENGKIQDIQKAQAEPDQGDIDFIKDQAPGRPPFQHGLQQKQKHDGDEDKTEKQKIIAETDPQTFHDIAEKNMLQMEMDRQEIQIDPEKTQKAQQNHGRLQQLHEHMVGITQ